ILALIFGILMIILGVVTLIFIVGILPLVFGIIDIIIYVNCKEIVSLVEDGEYRRAKEKTLVWMIIGFILGGILIGIVLLIAYLKYDELVRRVQSSAPTGTFV
ncbi:MAG: hypothetical protein QXM83_03600, partial [Ignisphaera sp.]